ncbi:XkdQ/YqbQ family protein [Paenibacillus aquistagni]|uniref:YqbQ/XkdQ domain-containing protein n=1 Tax=Paenibacillus aquistagni TaxID=1852522 RepID=A0A1X7LY59_9BACL|nr:hypothetical protein [Paenibacillus aquistagni]SMG58192.1 hypothetical protein SAMN06295960_4640 [Paenibacillus aquistagni]
MHELILVQGKTKRNITQLVGNVTWSSNMDALGVELSFDYAFNDSVHFEKFDLIEIGNHVVLMNEGKVISRFVIVAESVSGRFGKSYTCFDYSWYLNKNETVIQFIKASASQAIAKMLDRFGIKHKITPIKTLITKIYKDMTISDIINDILEQATQETKTKYRLEMNKDVLTISKMSDLVISPKVRLSSNIPLIPIPSALGNPSRSRSIEDMKNNVIVVNGKEDSSKVLASLKDSKSMARYGQLTEVITADEKNESQARNIAKNTLAEMNRIKETVSIEMLGHDDVRAGRILAIKEPVTGLSGNYLIVSASHALNNGIHKVSVELEAV